MSNKEKDKDSTRRVRTVKKRKKTSTKKKELDKTRIMSLIDEDDDEPKKATVNRKKSTSSKDGKNTKKGKKKVIKRDKTRTKSGKKKFRYRHPRIATIIRIALIVLILLTIIGIAVAIGSVYGFFGDELKISKEDLVLKYENSIVYDLDGNELATLSSGTKRKSVSMSEMSPYLPKAYVAIEDERFYSHGVLMF
jgi:penicillin-binding protein 1A